MHIFFQLNQNGEWKISCCTSGPKWICSARSELWNHMTVRKATIKNSDQLYVHYTRSSCCRIYERKNKNFFFFFFFWGGGGVEKLVMKFNVIRLPQLIESSCLSRENLNCLCRRHKDITFLRYECYLCKRYLRFHKVFKLETTISLLPCFNNELGALLRNGRTKKIKWNVNQEECLSLIKQ